MQNKIGEHIVNIAVAILGLGFTASIITFLVLIVQDIDNFGKALLIGGLGCLGSWVSFLFLAGFGLIISNTTQTVELLRQLQATSKLSDTPQKVTPDTTVSEDDIYKIIDESELTEEEKRNVKELIAWKNDGVITTQECRNRVSKILSNYSIAIQFRFLNKL